MIVAALLLFLEALTIMAYVLLVIGFFGVGIGILIGFFRMVKDERN
jgi:membrane-bound ClpP family serine protease